MLRQCQDGTILKHQDGWNTFEQLANFLQWLTLCRPRVPCYRMEFFCSRRDFTHAWHVILLSPPPPSPCPSNCCFRCIFSISFWLYEWFDALLTDILYHISIMMVLNLLTPVARYIAHWTPQTPIINHTIAKVKTTVKNAPRCLVSSKSTRWRRCSALKTLLVLILRDWCGHFFFTELDHKNQNLIIYKQIRFYSKV
jgi:hypothetical protein